MSENAEKIQNVLIAYDDTPASKRALERAAELTKAFSAKLYVISVVPIVYDLRGGPIDPTDTRERHSQQLDTARSFLNSQNVEAEFVEGVGEPGDTIIDAAEDKRANLIVIGSRALSMVERLLGQSVSGYVQRHARCDVLCVH